MDSGRSDGNSVNPGLWYGPIDLLPESGILPRIYLWSLHCLAGYVLFTQIPGIGFAPLVIGGVGSLRFHLARVLTRNDVTRVELGGSHRCSLEYANRRRVDVTLASLRVIGGIALLRIRISDATAFVVCLRHQQIPSRWHRLVLMQRFATLPTGRGQTNPAARAENQKITLSKV